MGTALSVARAGFLARASLLAGLMALAACQSTKLEQVAPPSNAGGQTNDPAAGFENVQPGSEEDFILNVGRRVYFAENSATLDPDAKVTVDNQIAFMKKYPQWYAKIQGFADDPGGDAKMVEISAKRANAVMAYMVSAGIAPGRLWAKGYGKERVVRDCTEKSCKVQNRRVVTNLRESREE